MPHCWPELKHSQYFLRHLVLRHLHPLRTSFSSRPKLNTVGISWTSSAKALGFLVKAQRTAFWCVQFSFIFPQPMQLQLEEQSICRLKHSQYIFRHLDLRQLHPTSCTLRIFYKRYRFYALLPTSRRRLRACQPRWLRSQARPNCPRRPKGGGEGRSEEREEIEELREGSSLPELAESSIFWGEAQRLAMGTKKSSQGSSSILCCSSMRSSSMASSPRQQKSSPVCLEQWVPGRQSSTMAVRSSSSKICSSKKLRLGVNDRAGRGSRSSGSLGGQCCTICL